MFDGLAGGVVVVVVAGMVDVAAAGVVVVAGIVVVVVVVAVVGVDVLLCTLPALVSLVQRWLWPFQPARTWR